VIPAWEVQLLTLSGGPAPYGHALRASASSQGGGVVAAPPPQRGAALQPASLEAALVVRVLPVLAATVYPFARWHALPALGRDTARVLALWVAPSPAVFAGVHFGQWGYHLLVLPLLLLLAAALLLEE
jgi:hypothetical protein